MDSGNGLSGSQRDCRPALQKGQKYQWVKNLTCVEALAGFFSLLGANFKIFHDISRVFFLNSFCSEGAVFPVTFPLEY